MTEPGEGDEGHDVLHVNAKLFYLAGYFRDMMVIYGGNEDSVHLDNYPLLNSQPDTGQLIIE